MTAETKVYSTKGKHVIVDVFKADEHKLNDSVGIFGAMKEGIEQAGATILNHYVHNFEPVGVSVTFTLSESHYTVHTYPKEGYASIDCYTCGETIQPAVAISHLLNFLKPEESQITVDALYVSRGIESGMVAEK